MKAYKVSRNEKCLCGSNKKFKYCCMNTIKKDNIFSKINSAIKEKDYETALMFCNANLTKYLISMKRDTVTLINRKKSIGYKLLEIDINALKDIFDTLGYIVINGELLIDIDAKLKRIETMFEYKSFFELVRYYRVLYIGILDNNLEKINLLLSELKYSEIEYVNLLEIYYQYIGESHGYAVKNEFIKKIIKKENDDYGILQYNILLSLNYKINKDKEYSLKYGRKALEILNKIEKDNIQEYELYVIANSLFFCGMIFENEDFYKKSILKFKNLIKLEKQSKQDPKHIANLFNSLGETYLMLNNYKKAIEVLEKGNEYYFTYLAHIKIAKAYLNMNNYKKANNEISGFDINNIPKDNLLDFLIVMGEILINNEDKHKAKKIYESLKKMNVSEKLFETYRNDLIIELLEKYKGFYEINETTNLKQKIADLNSVFTLNPNIFGFGININKIIEKILKKR